MQSDTHRASQFYAAFQGLCRGEDDADYLTCQRQLSDAFQTPSNAAFVVERVEKVLNHSRSTMLGQKRKQSLSKQQSFWCAAIDRVDVLHATIQIVPACRLQPGVTRCAGKTSC
jgi:hypothetical protein